MAGTGTHRHPGSATPGVGPRAAQTAMRHRRVRPPDAGRSAARKHVCHASAGHRRPTRAVAALTAPPRELRGPAPSAATRGRTPHWSTRAHRASGVRTRSARTQGASSCPCASSAREVHVSAARDRPPSHDATALGTHQCGRATTHAPTSDIGTGGAAGGGWGEGRKAGAADRKLRFASAAAAMGQGVGGGKAGTPGSDGVAGAAWAAAWERAHGGATAGGWSGCTPARGRSALGSSTTGRRGALRRVRAAGNAAGTAVGQGVGGGKAGTPGSDGVAGAAWAAAWEQAPGGAAAFLGGSGCMAAAGRCAFVSPTACRLRALNSALAAGGTARPTEKKQGP